MLKFPRGTDHPLAAADDFLETNFLQVVWKWQPIVQALRDVRQQHTAIASVSSDNRPKLLVAVNVMSLIDNNQVVVGARFWRNAS